MSHPVLWPKKIYFYPIGNTAPVCLTEALAPEESANVLLLGCGDPRSILYTLFAGVRCPGSECVAERQSTHGLIPYFLLPSDTHFGLHML
jgi:hypothetical protein